MIWKSRFITIPSFVKSSFPAFSLLGSAKKVKKSFEVYPDFIPKFPNCLVLYDGSNINQQQLVRHSNEMFHWQVSQLTAYIPEPFKVKFFAILLSGWNWSSSCQSHFLRFLILKIHLFLTWLIAITRHSIKIKVEHNPILIEARCRTYIWQKWNLRICKFRKSRVQHFLLAFQEKLDWRIFQCRRLPHRVLDISCTHGHLKPIFHGEQCDQIWRFFALWATF